MSMFRSSSLGQRALNAYHHTSQRTNVYTDSIWVSDIDGKTYVVLFNNSRTLAAFILNGQRLYRLPHEKADGIGKRAENESSAHRRAPSS